jgi:hypothetical protein
MKSHWPVLDEKRKPAGHFAGETQKKSPIAADAAFIVEPGGHVGATAGVVVCVTTSSCRVEPTQSR